MPNQRPARARLFQMAEDRMPVAERIFGEGTTCGPQFIQPYRCKNVLIEGVSAAPLADVAGASGALQNVTIRGLDIDSARPEQRRLRSGVLHATC